MTSTLQALIWDVDGTLAETERDGHRAAFNAAFAELGLPWRWSEARYGELLAVTGGKERILFYLENHRSQDPKPASNLNQFIAEMHRKKTDYYNHLLEENPIPLRPGIKRLLLEARQHHLQLAIATTTNLINVETLLKHSLSPTAIQWFSVISAGDIVSAKKPAPDIYFHALQALNLSPANCIAFEDSYNGLQAALGAQLPTLITVNDYTRHEDFTGALLVLDHLGEPDHPCQKLAGPTPLNSNCVEVNLLRSLLPQ